MKTHLLISDLRATIFIPFLPCDWSVISKLHEVIPDGVPSLSVDKPLMVGDVLFPPGSWTIANPAGNLRIVVQPQKVDFIKNVISDYASSDEYWKDFIEKTIAIFNIFMTLRTAEASRLAIAPSFYFGDGADNWSDFIRDSFTLRKFGESDIDTGDFTQTFRIKESFADKYFRFNFLAKFYGSNQIVKRDGNRVMEDFYNIEFDINTAPDKGYSFNINAMTSFYQNARRFSDSFLSHYFD